MFQPKINPPEFSTNAPPSSPIPANGNSAAPILIGGSPRSGTTLLRAIINAHPNIACGPELRAIPALCNLLSNISATSAHTLNRDYGVSQSVIDRAFADAIVDFIEPLRRREGKPRVAEKTPTNILHFPLLRRLFPQSPFVTIFRDPRDVVASLLSFDWRDGRTGERLLVTTDAGAAARLWRASVEMAERMSGDALLYAVKYEDLVAAPDVTIRGVFEFLGEAPSNISFFHQVAFDAASGENEYSNERVARPIDNASVGRWRSELTTEDLRIVEGVAGEQMARLGYE